MKTSPVKFEDLAFLLMFFFMIIAVISFSENKIKTETTETSLSFSSTEKSFNTIAVTLDKNGKLNKDLFADGDFIELYVEDLTEWHLVKNAIEYITDKGADVTLIVN